MDQKEEAAGRSVFGKIKDHLQHSDYLQRDVLKSLVAPAAHAADVSGDRGGVFPFLHGLRSYDPNAYRTHLKFCHRLWHESGVIEQEPWEIEQYGAFFANPDTLSRLA
jgi:hypothetical protein